MSKVIRCDRCGEIVDHAAAEVVYMALDEGGHPRGVNLSRDMCVTCARSVDECLRGVDLAREILAAGRAK